MIETNAVEFRRMLGNFALTEAASVAGRGRTDPAPFFIVGSGRSGSTLLRMIVASHPRLAIPPETWFVLPLVKRLPIDRPLGPEEVSEAVRIITGHHRWPDMNIDAREFLDVVGALDGPNLAQLVEVIYRQHMTSQGKQRWGDKTPGYIAVIPQLTQMFPGAKFLHLVRDGRDVTKSFQATGWNGPWLHDNMAEWVEAMDYQERWSQSRFANQILQVRYEDLVRRTEVTARQICDFLDETFDPQMLAWRDNVAHLVPAREMSIHGKLARRPDPGDVDRWQREMSAREVFVCEALIGGRLALAGYPRKFSSPVWTPAFALSRWYCRSVLPVVGWPLKTLWRRRQWRKRRNDA